MKYFWMAPKVLLPFYGYALIGYIYLQRSFYVSLLKKYKTLYHTAEYPIVKKTFTIWSGLNLS